MEHSTLTLSTHHAVYGREFKYCFQNYLPLFSLQSHFYLSFFRPRALLARRMPLPIEAPIRTKHSIPPRNHEREDQEEPTPDPVG